MDRTKQGVLSAIDFPLGQDEMAVSFAIGSLIKEGWEFTAITKTYIRLNRSWEVLSNSGEVEALNAEKALPFDECKECIEVSKAIGRKVAEKAEGCPEIEFVYSKEAAAQGITHKYHKELRTIISFKPKYKGLAKDSFEEGKLSTSGEGDIEDIAMKFSEEYYHEVNQLSDNRLFEYCRSHKPKELFLKLAHAIMEGIR